MRNEVWLWIYLAVVGSVLGGVWLHHRRSLANLREVSERAARLTPYVPAQRRPVDSRRPPVSCTVYVSKEAIKDRIIKEYDATRTTVLRLRPDPAELERVWRLARRVGQNDRTFTADLILQGHESGVSRDLDSSCQVVSLPVTRDAVFRQLGSLRRRLAAGPESTD